MRYRLHRPSPAPLFGRAGAALTVVFVPREFQIAGDTFDGTYRFVGPSLSARAAAGNWQPSTSRAPVRFISLGTGLNRRPRLLHYDAAPKG